MMRENNNPVLSGKKMLLLTGGLLGLLILILSLNSYFTIVDIYEDKELSRLKGVAKTLSLQLDGDMHQDLIQQYPKGAITSNEQDPAYLMLHNKLSDAMRTNEIETTIYTMVYDSSMNKFCFGVVSADEPFWKDDYRDFPEELLENYFIGGTIAPYKDKYGTWLSAFEPIKNSRDQVVGVLQIDQKFDSFIAEAKREVFKNICVVLLIVGVISFLVITLMRRLISQQHQIELERNEVNAFRKELIANVSHDLRTPLASIQGYLETILLKKDRLNTEQITKYVSRSLVNANKLKQLIEELFELSKLESKERKLNIEPVNIGELVHDIVNSQRIIAASKGVSMEVDIPEGLNQVRADIGLVDRVLNNLINNSIKFCEDGDEIVVKIRPCNYNKVHIYVSDTGKGIDEEDLPHIFNRYYKTQPQNKAGSGLGLAIVKNILELHGSHYEVTSQKNKGTTFYFTLDCYSV